ncbi:hypothetical protein SAMN05445060_2373 [Williamsia sterculiae]|uniref:Uncharacterized protein n=1 Tax=Williamsia sterculiae TaxID=1344003 RepID=A0A1N7FX75_9NOCA|nr:hypothetical protein SAMN05445060_2373 [Williamsia sterculiae]
MDVDVTTVGVMDRRRGRLVQTPLGMSRSTGHRPTAIGDAVVVIGGDGSSRAGVVVAVRHSPISYLEVELVGGGGRISMPLSHLHHYRLLS